ADRSGVLLALVNRALVAALEVGVIVLAGLAGAMLVGIDGWTASGGLALVYYPATSAYLGCTPALWWLQGQRPRVSQWDDDDVAASSNARPHLHLVARQA